MNTQFLNYIAAVAILLCAACGETGTGLQGYPTAAPPNCDFGQVRFNSDYAGGRVDGCSQTGPDSFLITLSPENSPVNHSPWYSFKVAADDPRDVSITLAYTEHEHRYVPKLSSDGDNWTAMPSQGLEILDDGKNARLSLTLTAAPLWVSAQELFNNEDYLAWTDELSQHPFVQRSLMGKSVEGRDIYKLETTALQTAERGRSLILVGRQHPPEVTGALAMKTFVERVLATDELAEEFRREFSILIVPNLNPDGVYHGNWRHNVNGIDLNRDWGPFSQPETRLMRDELARFLEPGAARPYLFLDFHSTGEDVLYTQLPEMKTFPENFADHWLDAFQVRADSEFPGYTVNPKPGHNVDEPTSKNYVYDTFGIPAITFELGDETERDFIDAYSVAAAEEMMKTLLAARNEGSDALGQN